MRDREPLTLSDDDSSDTSGGMSKLSSDPATAPAASPAASPSASPATAGAARLLFVLPPSAPREALDKRDRGAPGCWPLAARCCRASGFRPCDAAESPRCNPPPPAAESARCRPARLAAAGAARAASPWARRCGEVPCCRPPGMPSAAQAAWRAGSKAAASGCHRRRVRLMVDG